MSFIMPNFEVFLIDNVSLKIYDKILVKIHML